jgi:hypothetical protein
VVAAVDSAASSLAKVDPKPETDTKKPDSIVTGTTKPGDVAEVKKQPQQVVDTAKAVTEVVITKKPEATPELKTPQPAADSLKNIQIIDPPTKLDETETAKKKPEQDPIKDSVLNPPALPVISIVRQYATDTGYYMVVVDEQKDSINIFIPADAPVKQPEVKKDTVTKASEPDPILKPIDSIVTKPPVVPAKTDTVASVSSGNEKKLVMINSDCRSFATDNDVDKLRVKMVNEKDGEARINAAKKVFKTRCFSAQQLKALSEMFPYDEQKYKFLETAYPFASDTSNFKNLVTLLQDPVYVQRFRKLVRLD